VRPHLEGLEERTLLSGNNYVVNLLGDSGGAQGTQSGQFSGNLRWCINQADLPANTGSTISFDQSVFTPNTATTIGLSNGELAISNSMTITNAGGPSTIIISGTDGVVAPNGNLSGSRVFDIIPSQVTVSINGLTITGGNGNVAYTSLPGNQGGDIFNGGNLTLNDDIVSNGLSQGLVGGPPGRGGGIFNAEGQNGGPGATLTLNSTIVKNNEAEGANGMGAGGGIYNDINATVILQNSPQFTQNTQIINNEALGNNTLGRAVGGGVANVGILQINGTSTRAIVFADNLAQGGTQAPGLQGGDAFGGGVFNAGSMTLQFVNFLGNQAQGGAGGAGVPGGDGGAGGNAQGGGIYNAGGGAVSLPNVIFGLDAKGVGNEAVGGVGGQGGDGVVRSQQGGDGGDGGIARGGAVASTSGGLVFKSTTFTSSEAIGGSGGAGGQGFPGFLPTNLTGSPGGHGGAGGDAGDAFGGAVFNSSGTLNLTTDFFFANIAQGGQGGAGGNGAGGDTGPAGSVGIGGVGGFGGAGGVGGGAQGGGFYNVNATLSIGSTSFIANATGIGNEALGGNGGSGGNGGQGGQGGDNGSGLASIGAAGGTGGKGGNTRRVSGGAGADVNDSSAVINSATITSSLVHVGNGGQGGNGGRGGNSGNGASFPLNGIYGGAGGDGGAGGNSGPGLGGALAFTSSTASISSSPFGGSTAALGNQVIGGAGGAGGAGGNIGAFGHPSTTYVVAFNTNPPTSPPGPPEGQVNPAGDGGAGGTGSTVSGGSVSDTSAIQSGVDVLTRFQGLNFSQSGPFQGIQFLTPNAQGAAGTNSYLEAINQSLALFTKDTGSLLKSTALPDFFKTVGQLQHPIFGQFIDPAVVWDDQIQRFIVVDLDVDGSFNNPIVTQHQSFLDIAVSTSADPQSLTAADWNFYQVATTESPNGAFSDPQDTGNIGFNHDALVVTLNMYNTAGVETHVEVNTISLAALTTPGTLTQGTNAFQFDFTGANLRPTVMHDSVAGDPMWFVQAGANNSSINVVEMTDPLSTTATFASNPLGVKPYSPAVPMLQPIGGAITGVNSGIQKVAEYNNVLVAAQTVSDAAQDEDNIQWYAIDVSSGQPQMQQQGDVSGGPGVYDAFPSIDLNQNGDIGMTFAESGRAGPFLGMAVTGRVAADSLGTMRNPVLTQTGLQNYHGDLLGTQNPIGPVSGINVDTSDGSFWAVNQFADLETFTNWGTAIAHFTIPASTIPVQTVTMSNTTFTTSAVVAGAGGAGGSAGLGSDDGRNHGINGQGGNGGNAQGGTAYLSSTAAQSATLSAVTVTSSSARGGAGGAGAINTLGTDNITFYYRGSFGLNGHQFGWNGFGSSGGNGGSVKGVGLAAVNYALNLIPPATGTGTVSFNGGIGIAGSGGNGGGATAILPRSWDGGVGGNGGSVQGGAVFMSNNVPSTPLNFTFNGGTASNYTLTAGIAGSGGNAGASTTLAHRSNVFGGAGGLGGNAQGGGIYVFAGSKSINNVSFNNLSILNDHITAGTGGQGGAGFNATGGTGGIAQGGGVFNTSLNGGQNSSLFISSSTLAGDDATGGNGGNAGSGTTPNGGAGGTGGNAGNADGGGLFNGQNMPMTVLNSTFGGGSVNGTSGNANILTSGLGGRGGNAGTPAGVVRNNGGNGGNGGSVAGGNVYNSSTGAVFYNDTVVQGQAAIFGLGGAGGSGAGAGGLTGNPGNVGTGIAGGYFAANTTSNTMGNTILAFNSAAAKPDASGSFTSKGGNLLTSTVAGFNTGSGGGDVLVTTAYSANLGPLLNNGGPSPTDAVLPGSAAIGAGKLGLITTPPFSPNPLDNNQVDDQRGTGFVRAFQNVVSSGAFEFLPPTISSLSPSSVVEGSPGISLTVFGANFVTGATVTFGTTQLTPSSSSATQLVVGIPSNLLTTPGVVQVFVSVPDGSGISGHTSKSQPATFTIQATPFTLVNPGSQQGFEGEVVNLQIKPSTGFSATGFTDVVGIQHTLPPGLSIDANTGIISGTIAPNASTNSPYTVTISATDNNGDPASVTFQFKVLGPLFLIQPPDQTNNEGDKVTLQISAPPGYTPAGFIATGLPPGVSINTTTGLITGTIDPRGAGSYTVKVTPTNNNNQGFVIFNWTVNDSTPPALTNPGTQKTPAGVDVNLPIQAVDADPGTFTATGLPPGLLIDANGVIFGTISTSAQGVYAVTVQAADGPVKSAPVSFFWFVSGVASPPPSATPVSPPGSVPPGVQGVGTSTSIVNVTNQYQGFVQLETITVDVTAGGFTVNEGVVAISVDGQTAFAPVHNGVATATFATGLFDLNLLPDLIFTHPLTASYIDSAGTFASSNANTTLPAIWIDFLLTMLALDIGQLNQV
jgi:hypothetical protein